MTNLTTLTKQNTSNFKKLSFPTVKPFCRPDLASVYGALSGVPIRIPCDVVANPDDVDDASSFSYTWAFNSSAGAASKADHDRLIAAQAAEAARRAEGEGRRSNRVITFTPKVWKATS